MNNYIKPFSWLFIFFSSIPKCIIYPLLATIKHRELFLGLLKRDFVNRTSGTALGFIWLFLQPALQILALWFLISVILQVRFPGMDSFINYFLIGMIPWLAITEIIQRSTSLFHEFGVLFKRNPFPIIILPVLSISLTLIIYTFVYLIVVFLLEGINDVFPALIIMISIFFWLLPLTMLLSVIGVFIKDINQFIPFVLTMTLYLSPILYLPTMIPESLQGYLVFNPIADFMALIHFYLQEITPAQVNMFERLLIEWVILSAPAWIIFKRSEKHIREVI